jgi:hypothetical protein
MQLGGRSEASIGGAAGMPAGGWCAVRLASRVTPVLAAGILAALVLAALASRGQLGAGRAPATHSQRARLMLPAPLGAAASVRIGASEHSFWPTRHGGALLTAGGGISSRFTRAGATLRVGSASVRFSLAAVGRGGRLTSVAEVAPTRTGGRVEFRRGAITELYQNGPFGLEQAFTLRRAPTAAGRAPVVLALELGGSLRARRAGPEVLLQTRGGATALRYGQLSVEDASGRRLPASIHLRGGALRLQIDDRRARYPLRIDPFFQQGPKLIASGESGKATFGEIVSLSADGNTALIGGPNDANGTGAAWVFVRSGSTWEQQGGTLTGSGEIGKGHFGNGAALSADGNTAVISGGGDNGEVGAAWVFTRNEGSWEQQGPKLTGGEESGAGHFGFRVAVSGDGDTALVGGPLDASGSGAAWVFTRNESSWEQQGPKLTGGEESGAGEFGVSVALSADGRTALIGGGGDNGEIGAAWVFTRNESSWGQQGPKLTGAEEVGKAHFGFRVALSADGNTALVGGGSDSSELGAAWAFTRSESTWTQQGSKLTAGGETGKAHFGYSVALSADGNTALIGGLADNAQAGAAWLFGRSESTWTQQGSKLTASGETGKALFGYSVALSADATTGLIGGPNDNSEVGAAWAFVAGPNPPPSVSSVTPSTGPSTGGTKVTIRGTGFVPGATVAIGSPASSVKVVSETELTAVTTATAPGSDEVVVSDANGTSTGGPSYTYTPPPPPKVTSIEPASGPSTGGTKVTIKGTGFVAGATVTIGNGATSVKVATATKITAVTSATELGSYEVVVSDANGTSTGGPSYTYVPPAPPTVTSVEPASGSSAGGTKLIVKGTGFLAGAAVTIGHAATAVKVATPTKITAVTTATEAGSYEVVVSDANGTSTDGPLYNYLAPLQPKVSTVSPKTGPAAGGTSVTITGTDLTSGSTPVVDFGSTEASEVTVISGKQIVAVAPPVLLAGTVDITVTTAGGTSATITKDRFTYTLE